MKRQYLVMSSEGVKAPEVVKAGLDAEGRSASPSCLGGSSLGFSLGSPFLFCCWAWFTMEPMVFTASTMFFMFSIPVPGGSSSAEYFSWFVGNDEGRHVRRYVCQASVMAQVLRVDDVRFADAASVFLDEPVQ